MKNSNEESIKEAFVLLKNKYEASESSEEKKSVFWDLCKAAKTVKERKYILKENTSGARIKLRGAA